MTILARLIAMGLFALACHPLMAHGGERHGETEQASSTKQVGKAVSADTSVGATHSGISRGPVPSIEHETSEQSIWARLHPASVHFPIALLLGAALIEVLSMIRGSASLASAAGVMTWLGAGGAVTAAALGWIHTGMWLGGDATMQWHRWSGTVIAIAAPMAALLSRLENRRAFRILLFVIASALLAQGYWGGELAHGPNHLGL